MTIFALLLVIAGGVATGTQVPTNASLGKLIGPLGSSFVNFTVALVIISAVTLLFGSGDLSAALDAPWWQFLGGAYGVIIVTAGIVSSPVLGVALFTTLLMVGQLGMGMVVDSFGLFGAAVHPLTSGRICGFLVILVGILLIYRGRRTLRISDEHDGGNGVGGVAADGRSALSGVAVARSVAAGGSREAASETTPSPGMMAFAMVFALAAGASVSIQVPTNTSLAASTGTLEAAWVSFVGGFLLLLVICLIAQRGKLRVPHGAKPWQLIGGVYGVFLVLCNMIASLYLGVGLAVAAALLGTVAIALVIDTLGWFGTPRIPLNKWRLAGVLVVAAGILLACVFSAAL